MAILGPSDLKLWGVLLLSAAAGMASGLLWKTMGLHRIVAVSLGLMVFGAAFVGIVVIHDWLLDRSLDRLREQPNDALPPPEDEDLARVKHLSLAEAREQAEAVLPDRFALEPQKRRVDLTGLPDGVKSLFDRYSHIRPDHTFSWLDSGLLQRASWDPTLRIIGTDRDGLVIATRSDSEDVYEIDWEYDDPESPDQKRMHPEVAAVYPSVYHWILANVWDEPV